MTALELLTRARAIQAERGHRKEIFGSTHGRCCALGAINAAESGDPKLPVSGCSDDIMMARRLLAAAIISEDQRERDEFGNDDVDVITRFNDSPETTLDDVLAAFDRAITLASEAP